MAQPKAAPAEQLKSDVLARLDASAANAPRGAIPGLDLIKSAVVEFLVQQVVTQAADAIEANRDEVIAYVSEKAGELTGAAIDGAQGLLDALRDSLGGR